MVGEGDVIKKRREGSHFFNRNNFISLENYTLLFSYKVPYWLAKKQTLLLSKLVLSSTTYIEHG
jgi:hypothetical protein